MDWDDVELAVGKFILNYILRPLHLYPSEEQIRQRCIGNLLADAITKGRATCGEMAKRIEAALLAEAAYRGTRAGEIACKEIIAGRGRAFPKEGGVMLDSLEKLLIMVEGEQMDAGDSVAIGQDSFCSAELLLSARVELDTIRGQ